MQRKKLLILGGTGDAADLARRASDFFGGNLDIIVSYSGITGHQPDLPCEVRVGGFGGPEGLISYIKENEISHMVDATHPFAEKMTQHAFIASNALNLPTLVMAREEWVPTFGDRWLEVDSMEDAVKNVRELAVKTFLTIGTKELAAFDGLDEVTLVVRLLEEPKENLSLSNYDVVTGRPPFSVESECELLREHNIRLMVTKNSGGDMTRAKLDAARSERISVIMVNRPLREPLEYVSGPAQAIQWLSTHGV